jgi:O-antigen ligase/tetratricopeptide (TPR) repeat protein
MPLPRAVAAALSPGAARLYDKVPGLTPAAWLPLSLRAAASLELAGRLTAYAAVFAVAAALAARGRGAGRRILTAVFAVGLFQALYGSYEYLTGHQHIFGYAKRFYTDSATGTYINQNHYAGALEMALLCGLGLFLASVRGAPSGGGRRAPGWRTRVVALFDGQGPRTFAIGGALALCALGLVFSYSRMGLAAASLASAGVVLVALRRSSGRRRGAAILLLAAAGLLLASLAGWNRIASDLSRQMTPVSWDEGRLLVWRDSTAIVRNHPLAGAGLGTFRDVYPAYRSPRIVTFYDHAHNDWLELAVETGAAGSLLALAILALYGIAVARGLARLRGPDFPVLLGAAGALVALLLHEITDFNLQIPANAVLFAATAGVLLGSLRAADRAAGRVVSFRASGPRDERPRLSLGRAAGVALAIAATLAAAGAWREFEGRRLLGVETSMEGGAAAGADAGAAPSGENDPPVAAGEAAQRERLDRLERAAHLGTAAPEARAAIADVLVDRAAAKTVSDEATGGGARAAGEDLRRALGEVQRALTASPADTDAWIAGYRVAQAASQIGAFAGMEAGAGRGGSSEPMAQRFAEGALRSDPNGGHSRRRLASLMLAAGERDAARAGFCAAVGDPSEDVRAVGAEMLDGGFAPEEVAACFPELYEPRAALAQLFAERRLPEDAERVWQRAAALDPSGGAAVWAKLSNLAAAQGRSADALAYAQKGLARLDQASPGLRAEVLYAAAMAARDAGNPAAAIDYAERSLKEDPRQLFLSHFAATLRFERGDTAEAIKLWKSLLEDHAQDLYVIENRALFHRSLGQAYERLGLTDPAADQYRQALEASPNDGAARKGLERATGLRQPR